jgi:hypothetical protein
VQIPSKAANDPEFLVVTIKSSTKVDRPMKSAIWRLIKRHDYSDEIGAQQLPDKDFKDWRLRGFPRNTFAWFGLAIPALSLSTSGVSTSSAKPPRFCVPASIEELPTQFFEDWTRLEFVAFEFGSRLTSLPEYGFCGCSSLRSICIPGKVQIARAHCFESCRSLEWVGFDGGATDSSLGGGGRLLRLGDAAFAQCPCLRSFKIPASIEFVDATTFEGTLNLGLVVAADNCHFERRGMFLCELESNSIVGCFDAQPTVTIPNCVETLSRGFLCDCSSSVREVVFETESKVRLIDSEAFRLSRLTRICICSSVEVLGESCFADCRHLRIVTFAGDSKLKELRCSAFEGCEKLLAICLPASVEVIGQSCFSGCSSLWDVTFAAESRLLRIERFAFFDCILLRSICIPGSVRMVSAFAFRNCRSLEHFTFGGGAAKRPFEWMYTWALVRRELVAGSPRDAGLIGLGLLIIVLYFVIVWLFM